MSNDMQQLLGNLIFIVPIIAIMGWMFYSQRKKNKQVKDMIDSIKEGVWIKTIGGFYGRVVSVKEDTVTFECGPDKSKLVISKGAIATVENSDVSNDQSIEAK